MWLLNLLSIIYWRGSLFLIVCFWLCFQRLFAHMYIVIFLDFEFCSIGLWVCFSANSMLFWLSSLCSIIWSQGIWYLWLCSFFLRMALAIWSLLWFHKIFFYFLIEIVIVIFTVITLNLYIDFGNVDTLCWFFQSMNMDSLFFL